MDMTDIFKIWVESFVLPFKYLTKILSGPTFWYYIFTILLPLILFYSACYLFLIIGTFVLWKLPESFPIPFYNPILGLIGDRVAIAAGICLIIHSEIGND